MRFHIKYIILFTTVAFVLHLLLFFFGVYKISGFSMYPALSDGHYVLTTRISCDESMYSKFFYIIACTINKKYNKELDIGDVVIVNLSDKENGENKYIAKRIIGGPGDKVVIENGRYFMLDNVSDSFNNDSDVFKIPKKGDVIRLTDSNSVLWGSIVNNSHKKQESIVIEESLMTHNVIETLEVKQKYYFLKGDMDNVSIDSRELGLMPSSDIVERVEIIIWPI